MILTMIFLFLALLFFLGAAIYVNYKKKKAGKMIKSSTEDKKKQNKSNKNIADILEIKIKDNIINLGNRYSSILRLGNIDYNMLSDSEQESIENVLMQTALAIDYPIQFFSTTEYVDTTGVIKQIKENKVYGRQITEYREYLINYLQNLMENKNISIIKNYAIISYDGFYETAVDELIRRCNSFKGNLLRAKITAEMLDENELYNLIYRELNKNSKAKVDLSQEGGHDLYVTKGKRKKAKKKE